MKRRRKLIYLDYAAATPVDISVAKKMAPFLSGSFGNPGSIHSFGVTAGKSLESARKETAMILGAKPDEIIFTSGGTESNNLAILGASGFFRRMSNGKKLHIISTTIEHHAVSRPLKFLENSGFEITSIPVSKKGIVSVDDIRKAIKDNTILVSVMYANNEVGTIQPIREIGNMLKELRGDRPYPLFHADACQAPGALSLQVSNLGVDMLSLSGSKFYGPKGSGILYLKKGVPIDPIIFGGGQEAGMRSGTQNVAAAVGFSTALKIADEKRKKETERLTKIRDYFIISVKKLFPDSELNGDDKKRLPNNVNIYFPGISSEQLVIELDVRGIAVSTGSACSSRELSPSHVITAMYENEERADSSVRFALGRSTTKTEIDKTLKVLKVIIERLRKNKISN